MSQSKGKVILNSFTTVLVSLVVLLAVLLTGVRLAGMQVYTVLSGSMEPAYPVGCLIYVKETDRVSVGDVITFYLDENTIATHRVVEIFGEEEDPTSHSYRTKGDANEVADGDLVPASHVIGKPFFTIPYLGYLANYIQHPPGKYIAIGTGAMLLLLVFLPDMFTREVIDHFKKKRRMKKLHPGTHPGAAGDDPMEELP